MATFLLLPRDKLPVDRIEEKTSLARVDTTSTSYLHPKIASTYFSAALMVRTILSLRLDR